MAFSWQIRLRRRGELEPQLAETREEQRKPQLHEIIRVHLREEGPTIPARIVHFVFVPPTVADGKATYRITANEIKFGG